MASAGRARVPEVAREHPSPSERPTHRRDAQRERQRPVDRRSRVPGVKPEPEVVVRERGELGRPRWQAGVLGTGAQRDEQAAERVRDRGVAPVERGVPGGEDVVGVHVGVVEAGRDREACEFRAPVTQPRRQCAQRLVPGGRYPVGRADRPFRGRVGEHLVELPGNAVRAEVGQAEAKQFRRVRCQAELQPGVAAQHGLPGAQVVGSFPGFGKRLAAVPGQQPGPVEVHRDRSSELVREPVRERVDQRWLEAGGRRAGLEPHRSAAGRDADDHGIHPRPGQRGTGAAQPGSRAPGGDPLLRLGDPRRVLPWRSAGDGLGRVDIGEFH